MSTMFIANNCTVESGHFMGDQLCYVKIAYLFVQNAPVGTDKIVMSMSPGNSIAFAWQKFIDVHNVEVVYDDFNPGDNVARHSAWDEWRQERAVNGMSFTHYRELYLRIHGGQRQTVLCGFERGFNRRNIFEYVYYGQEHNPDSCEGSDWFDESLFYHPERKPVRDVYIAPFCKTQGNYVFTMAYWEAVVRHLVRAGVTVTVGHDGPFCDDLLGSDLYRKHFGSFEEWHQQVCAHKLVACGNTGTGWVAAACGVPLITMEPHNSVMADHRYRQCGLRNLVEVVDGYTLDSMNNDMVRVAEYVAQRIIDYVKPVVVMTTGCYDVLHAGHVRHLERSKALGTRLIVALNSDESVRQLKGPGRPINTQDQRITVLQALRCVDEVRVFDGPDATHLVREVHPQILTAGFGYTEADIKGRELVGRVAVTCTGDASNEPSTTKILRQVIRVGDMVELCHRGAVHSVNSVAKLVLMAEQYIGVSQLSGDIADVGAYKGGCSYVLRHLAPEKHLHLFDTWTGNPFDDPLCHHKKGEWAVHMLTCKKFVGNGALTFYHEGVFPGSTCRDCINWEVEPEPDLKKELVDRQFCFVYVDPDTYQTVQSAIEFFWPRLVRGGKLMFDDYGWEPCAGVKKAVDASFAESERLVIQNQYACVVTKR